MHDFIVQIR